MIKYALPGVMGLCLSILATTEAKAAGFTFTRIADTTVFSSVSSPAINDQGTVAFLAGSPIPISGISSDINNVFRGDGGPVSNIYTPLLNPSGPRRGFVDPLAIGNPQINNAGTVAFTRTVPFAPQGLADLVLIPAPGQPLSRSYSSNGGIYGFSLNDIGEVAVTSQDLNASVLRTPSRIWGRTGAERFSISGLSINNAGTVVFAGNNPENRTERGIFQVNNNGVISSVLPETPSFGNFRNTLINDQGTIAFLAGSGTSSQIVSINQAGTRTNIAQTNSVFTNFGALSLNVRGTVAFFSDLNNGGKGIFLGSDPVQNKVIAIGDSLFNTTVTDLQFASDGLNNFGQVTFFARLSNGSTGIFRANPVLSPSNPRPASPPEIAAVPEPASALGLLGFAAISASSMLKRQTKKQA
ncbi:MAG: choice-of-anchor tandem repeat NxxGxxAF-containing protein [Nostocaceae cyanobacterium]|nr:choice-of-anchor tandem repeat NxxGxxAF-containing protein [Nostocaceae cyanobacterium]